MGRSAFVAAIALAVCSLAAVTIAAGAPASPTMARLPGLTATPRALPAPTNFLIMNDPKACPAHGGIGGGLACQALLPKGGLALIWQYGPVHIDGFRAYIVPNPRRSPSAGQGRMGLAGPNTPVSTQTARLTDGSVATLIVLDPRPGGYEGACLTVTAFAGASESPMTPPYCIGSNATARTVSLAPTHELTSIDELFFDPSAGGPAPGSDHHDYDLDPFKYGAVVRVGHYRRQITSDGTINAGVQRGALVYDVAALRGSTIYKAVLHLTRDSAAGSTCITEIDAGPAAWWTTPRTYLPRVNALMTTDSFAGKTFDIDVTPIVSGWAAGQPNNGLVLIGDDWRNVVFQLEAIPDTCVTSLLSVTLEVTYF